MLNALKAAGLAAVLAVSLTSAASAAAPAGSFGGTNGVWVNDYPGHYTNTNNTAVRKDDCGRKTSPGQGGYNANGNSVVSPGDNVYFPQQATLIDPHQNAGTCPA